MYYHRIEVGVQSGAVTAFASDPFGNLVGLSTAHVLGGLDGSLGTQEPVRIWDHTRNWVACGETINLSKITGSASGQDFGYIDAGLFRVNESVGQFLSAHLQPLWWSTWLKDPNHKKLLGRQIQGFAVSGKAPLTPITGIIEAVQSPFNVEGRILSCDLIISIQDGGFTNKGDSGMLWLAPDGKALALHFAGYPEKNSTISLATFIHRVAGVFSNMRLQWRWLGMDGFSQQMPLASARLI